MKKTILFYITICLSLPLACMEPDAKERELFEAIRDGKIKEVEKLIEAGLDVDIVRMYQEKAQRPIDFAFEQGQNEIILLLHTAIENLTEKKFMAALSAGDIETVQRLSYEVNKSTIYNVLKTAITKNDTPVIQILINKADLNDIQEALILAIDTKNPATVKTVLDSTLYIHIDQPDENSNTPLIHALNTHNINIIKAILTEVPNPTIKGSQKKTALEIAQEAEKNLLTKAEAQFNLFEAIRESRSDLQSFITSEVLNLNILSLNRNPLAAAIDKNNLSAIKLLVEEGKKINPDFVNQRLKGNITPLLIAVYTNKSDIVKFLLENGANPNTPPDIFYYNTPLSKATKDHNLEIMKLLLENKKNKADVNYQTPPDNITSLMIAVYEGYVDAVEMLLKFGADPLLQTIDGATALEIAKEEKETTRVLDDQPLLEEYKKLISILEKAEQAAKKAIPTDKTLIPLLHKFTQSLQALLPKLKK